MADSRYQEIFVRVREHGDNDGAGNSGILWIQEENKSEH